MHSAHTCIPYVGRQELWEFKGLALASRICLVLTVLFQKGQSIFFSSGSPFFLYDYQFKGMRSPKKLKLVIIYFPSCSFKLVWCYIFFCGTQNVNLASALFTQFTCLSSKIKKNKKCTIKVAHMAPILSHIKALCNEKTVI